jgi:FixJ family two-component response regulator
MLIVIIDDEESVRTGLRRLCVSLGLRASVYASGSEFLESLAAGATPPHCLLLDAHMPHMSGLEVQRHVVDAGLKVPTIVYTADDAPEAEARYVAAGVTAYLRKPIAGDELLAAIEQVMATHPTASDQRPTAAPPSQVQAPLPSLQLAGHLDHCPPESRAGE